MRERDLRPVERRAPERRPLEIVIDGTDGAGKTPCVTHLVDRLTKRGLSVRSHAPFREREVYALWDSDPDRAARIIVEIMDRFRAAHVGADVVVWDRGWPTAFISTNDTRARARFLPLPTITVLLLSTIDRTREMAVSHPDAGVWATDEELLHRYSAAYHRLDAPTTHRFLRFFPDDTSMFALPVITSAIEAAMLRTG